MTNMKDVRLVAVLLVSFATLSSAANILALLPTPSRSHHIWNSPLLVALARRGHNVTVVGPEPNRGAGPNLTDLVVDKLYETVAAEYKYEEMTEVSQLVWIKEHFLFMAYGCRILLHSPAFKQLMAHPPDFKFDLVITEAAGAECMFGLFPKFGHPPIVATNPYGVGHWIREITGSPNFPSYMPYATLVPYTDRLSFIDRMWNVCYNAYSYYYYHYVILPMQDKLAKEYFGQGLPPAESVLGNISIVMSNFNLAIDYAWPHTPNLIPVGGIQISEPKPLPKGLQEFMDGAKDGVIYFSLGSNVRSDKLPVTKQKEIVAAFALLPQRVLWKFESDTIGKLPENVRISNWLPQRDILAHPNTRLFISHGGGLSTHETIHRGVPMLGVPFLADQHINVRKVTNHGAGVLLEYRDLTADSLLRAVKQALHPTVRENMRALSERFRDFPMTPLERAVFWTEYVIKHKGAKHLRPASLDLNLVQYLLLDVIALLIAIPVVIVCALKVILLKKRKSGKSGKQKTN